MIYRYCNVLINNLSLKACRLVKGTTMGTKFAAVGSNVVVAYEEIKMFALLPRLNQQNFVQFFTRNFFWILDDVFRRRLENFDREPFYNMINNLKLALNFTSENPSRS